MSSSPSADDGLFDVDPSEPDGSDESTSSASTGSGSGGTPKQTYALPGDEYPWLVKIVDRLNAILVKEVRQALKSRAFVIVFMLLILASWLVTVFGLLNSGPSIEYSAIGRWFFVAFAGSLATAIALVVPFGVHRSLAEERSGNTFDLLQITTLSPRQIVWGKLLTASVQIFLLYSAVTPFIAFSSLLQGFDAPTATYCLVVGFLGGMMICMVSLMLTTMAKGKGSTGAAAVVILIGLLYAVGGSWAGVTFAAAFPMPFEEEGFWWFNGIALAFALSYFFLFQQIAVTQLTFESDNRSTGIRIATTAQYLLALLCVIVPCVYFGDYAGELVYLCVTVAGLHWMFWGLFFVTEPDALSARIRRDLPKSKFRLILKSPWLPGGTRGFALLLLVIATIWIGGVTGAAFSEAYDGRFYTGGTPVTFDDGEFQSEFLAALTLNIPNQSSETRFTHIFCCYLIIFLGFATSFARWGNRAGFNMKPAVPRAITLLVIAGGMIAPLVIDFFEIFGRGRRTYHPIDMLNPIVTLDRSTSSTLNDNLVISMLCLSICAVVMILFNLKAIFTAIPEVRHNPSRETDEDSLAAA